MKQEQHAKADLPPNRVETAKEVRPAEVRRPPGALPGAGDVFAVMRRRWPVVAGAAIAGMLLAWLFTAVQPRTYRANALAAVAPVGDALAPGEILRGVEVLEQRTVVATLAALASTPEVLEQSMEGGAGRGYEVEASVLPNTNLLRISVEGENATRAAEIANRIPSLLGRRAQAIYRFYGVIPVSPASTPREATSPRELRAVLAGLLIGLILGAAVAYVLERFRPRSGQPV